MVFKLGSESRNFDGKTNKNRFHKDDVSVPGTPVIRKKLAKGIKAEANIDGSIYLDESVEPNSMQERAILLHEMKHLIDMKTGKLSYTDDSITWMGETYNRKNGKIEFEGEWVPEGSRGFPWEQH